MTYEDLLVECEENGLIVKDKPLKSADGRIYDNKIALRKGLSNIEKTCVLAEELGHFKTGAGNILKQSNIDEIKQENKARRWAYFHLISFENLIQAFENGCSNLYETAEFLNVSESFLKSAIAEYEKVYGQSVRYKDTIIYFNPNFAILKFFKI